MTYDFEIGLSNLVRTFRKLKNLKRYDWYLATHPLKGELFLLATVDAQIELALTFSVLGVRYLSKATQSHLYRISDDLLNVLCTMPLREADESTLQVGLDGVLSTFCINKANTVQGADSASLELIRQLDSLVGKSKVKQHTLHPFTFNPRILLALISTMCFDTGCTVFRQTNEHLQIAIADSAITRYLCYTSNYLVIDTQLPIDNSLVNSNQTLKVTNLSDLYRTASGLSYSEYATLTDDWLQLEFVSSQTRTTAMYDLAYFRLNYSDELEQHEYLLDMNTSTSVSFRSNYAVTVPNTYIQSLVKSPEYTTAVRMPFIQLGAQSMISTREVMWCKELLHKSTTNTLSIEFNSAGQFCRIPISLKELDCEEFENDRVTAYFTLYMQEPAITGS